MMRCARGTRPVRRRLTISTLAALGTALIPGAVPVAAQTAHAGARRVARAAADSGAATAPVVGTIVVAHGASDEWNAPVLEAAATAEAAGTGGPVEVAFLMGDAVPEYRFQDAAHRLVEQGATGIVVVPLFASSHSSHYEQIRWLAGERADLEPDLMRHLSKGGIERPGVDATIVLTKALDASMEIATILADRALALAEDPPSQALFIVGHGPNAAEDYAGWMRNLRPVADSIARFTGFRDVKLGLVRDDAPEEVRAEAIRRIREIIRLQHDLTGRDVVVVPLLVSKGYISTQKLPEDLDGLAISYDGEGLLPHEALAEWIVRRVNEAGVTAAGAAGSLSRPGVPR